jgi:hypothetical protein
VLYGLLLSYIHKALVMERLSFLLSLTCSSYLHTTWNRGWGMALQSVNSQLLRVQTHPGGVELPAYVNVSRCGAVERGRYQ